MVYKEILILKRVGDISTVSYNFKDATIDYSGNYLIVKTTDEDEIVCEPFELSVIKKYKLIK